MSGPAFVSRWRPTRERWSPPSPTEDARAGSHGRYSAAAQQACLLEQKKKNPAGDSGLRACNQSQRRINSRASCFNRVPEALVAGHVEQFIDDLLQRHRLNMMPERLCNFPDRVVGRRHARRSSRAVPPRFNAARGSGGRGMGRATNNRESTSESIGQASAHRKRTRARQSTSGPRGLTSH
jgi:hypothetical protein